MAGRTFNIPKTTGTSKVKALDATDVAARYFVYKLYEACDGHRMQWATLWCHERQVARAFDGPRVAPRT
jgi:hypothetical protein